MKLWTVQSRDVVDILKRDGIYYPDFSRSRFMGSPGEQRQDGLSALYGHLLDSYNRLNGLRCRGLVFAMAEMEESQVYGIEDYGSFLAFLLEKRPALSGLCNAYFSERDSAVLELDLSFNLLPDNPILIYINDWQAIMPPVIALPPYTEEMLLHIIKCSIGLGTPLESPLPSGVAQVHLPYIRLEDVAGVYGYVAPDALARIASGRAGARSCPPQLAVPAEGKLDSLPEQGASAGEASGHGNLCDEDLPFD